MWRDEPMFDLPPSGPVKRAKSLRELDRVARGQISRYRPVRRVPCDECVLVLHEADGRGPYPRAVRWRFTRGRTVLLLCNEHAELRRKEGTAT